MTKQTLEALELAANELQKNLKDNQTNTHFDYQFRNVFLTFLHNNNFCECTTCAFQMKKYKITKCKIKKIHTIQMKKTERTRAAEHNRTPSLTQEREEEEED